MWLADCVTFAQKKLEEGYNTLRFRLARPLDEAR